MGATPAMFMVNADVLPIMRNTAKFSRKANEQFSMKISGSPVT